MARAKGSTRKQAATADQSGVIRDGETYTLAELERRSGLGVFAMRQLRRKGLIVRRISGRAFVRGEDFNRFLMEATTSASASGAR